MLLYLSVYDHDMYLYALHIRRLYKSTGKIKRLNFFYNYRKIGIDEFIIKSF